MVFSDWLLSLSVVFLRKVYTLNSHDILPQMRDRERCGQLITWEVHVFTAAESTRLDSCLQILDGPLYHFCVLFLKVKLGANGEQVQADRLRSDIRTHDDPILQRNGYLWRTPRRNALHTEQQAGRWRPGTLPRPNFKTKFTSVWEEMAKMKSLPQLDATSPLQWQLFSFFLLSFFFF